MTSKLAARRTRPAGSGRLKLLWAIVQDGDPRRAEPKPRGDDADDPTDVHADASLVASRRTRTNMVAPALGTVCAPAYTPRVAGQSHSPTPEPAKAGNTYVRVIAGWSRALRCR